VSGKGQAADDRDGLPRQREAVRRYAATAGVELVGEYIDAGVTGKAELENRPGLAALLDRIQSNGVRLVLVERADRLARDLMVGEIILAQFRAHGVTVLAADSGTDLTVGDDDPTRTLIRQVLGAVAEFDRKVTVLKLRAARERMRARTGRCEGRKPFGTRPGEDATLAKMKALFRKPRGGRRRSFRQVADALNAAGLKTRQDGQWQAATVRGILIRKGC
jgi:DNA invertase Pin-like site-specific DNA recombinase